MKAAESTWSPFQSPEVREICAHLTAAERQQLVARAARFGQETVWRVAVPVAAVAMAFWYSPVVGCALLALLATYVLAIELPRIRAHHQRIREFLAATEFAQARGYRSDAIRMFALPWTR